MNIALFGGTFDPIHVGHLQAARKAAERFRLSKVLFVPSGDPPHKTRRALTAFEHRFAMVSLACSGKPRFVPSLLEAPNGRLRYSVDTATRLRKTLRSGDRLFFLLGLDAFLDIPQWRDPERLLELVDFIIVSRPGFRIEDVLRIIPPGMLKGRRGAVKAKTIVLKHSTLHILSNVNVPIASHEIRSKIAQGRSVTGLISPLVKEYIMKEELYQTGRKLQR